jgi:hypothetical protein
MAEIYLCGWSDAAKRPRVFVFTNYSKYAVQQDSGPATMLATFPELPAEYMPSPAAPESKRIVGAMEGLRRYFTDSPDGRVPPLVARHHHDSGEALGRLKAGDLQVSVADGLVPMAKCLETA